MTGPLRLLPRTIGALLLPLALLWSAPAWAATVRLAVLVGNNNGNGDRLPLRYAERDAAKMARVLGELGRVAPEDLFLLQGRSRTALQGTFDRLQQKIAAIHREPGMLALLIFYFSGHSDGEALELGSDRLAYAELRKRLLQSGADTRVIIVDSCRSGALLAAKGGVRVPAFDISLADDLPATGQVLLTSSAANEQALESSEIEGSFFTHHLVSGLRGAADISGDGRVTLAEAYRYAYAHTVAATADQLAVTQHPGYDFQIVGTGELVLTDLTQSRAQLQLPTGFDRALVIDPRRNEVLAEVAPGAAQLLVVPPGSYLVRLWRKGKSFSGRTVVGVGIKTAVTWAALESDAPAIAGREKGGAAPAPTLHQAIEAYQRLDDARAIEAFQSLLATSPPREVAAKAHMYLGLIAFNGLHLDLADEEFCKAIRLNPTLDVPTDTSPKATLAFGQARQEVTHEVTQPEAMRSAPLTAEPLTEAAAPPSIPSLVAVPAPAVEPRPSHSHVLSFVLGGSAVALGVVAAVGGVQVLNYNAAAGSPNGGAWTGPQAASAESSANFWRVAWIAFAAGGAAALAAGVLTW